MLDVQVSQPHLVEIATVAVGEDVGGTGAEVETEVPESEPMVGEEVTTPGIATYPDPPPHTQHASWAVFPRSPSMFP